MSAFMELFFDSPGRRMFVTRDFDPHAGLETTTRSPRSSDNPPTYTECALDTGKVLTLYCSFHLRGVPK